MAFSAASLESYSPIIFMPGAISVTTEHFLVVVSRPTKYFPPPVSTAKAGAASAPIRTAATRNFFIFVSLGELAGTAPQGKSTFFGDPTNQISVNRVNARISNCSSSDLAPFAVCCGLSATDMVVGGQ